MKKTDSETRLREAIEQLEKQQAVETALLKEQFHLAAQSLQPISLLKKTFKAAAAAQDIKQDILNTSIGLGIGYLSKRLLNNGAKNTAKNISKSSSKGTSKKLIGAAILLGFAAVIAKNPEAIKSFGKNVLKQFLHKSSEEDSDTEYE